MLARHHATALFLQWEFSHLQEPWQLRGQKREQLWESLGKKRKFPLATQVTSCTGSKSETGPLKDRNKGAEITSGPFQTPDPQERSTGVSVELFVYTHISNLQGEGGMCSLVQPKGIVWGPWAITAMESIRCCVEVWAQCGLDPRRGPTDAKKCRTHKTTSSYLPSFSLTTDKFQLVEFGVIKHVISMRIGLLTHLSLCPQGKPFAWHVIAAS